MNPNLLIFDGTFERKSPIEVVFGDEIKTDAGLIGEFKNIEMTFVELKIGGTDDRAFASGRTVRV